LSRYQTISARALCLSYALPWLQWVEFVLTLILCCAFQFSGLILCLAYEVVKLRSMNWVLFFILGVATFDCRGWGGRLSNGPVCIAMKSWLGNNFYNTNIQL